MSEQQYRVIADRLENNPEFWIGGDEDTRLHPDIQDAVEVLRRDELLLPTREQIAEAIQSSDQPWLAGKHYLRPTVGHFAVADAVLALLQKEADRG